MRKVLFLFTLLAFVLTSPVWAADISGTWKVNMKSPQGEDETFNLAIKAAGENLTITCSNHPVLQTLEGTGILKGNAIIMSLKATGDMAVEFEFAGIVAGNKMSGTRNIGMSGGGAPGGAASGARSGAPSGAPGGAPSGGERGAPPGGERGAPPEGGERGAPPSGARSGAPSGAASGGWQM